MDTPVQCEEVKETFVPGIMHDDPQYLLTRQNCFFTIIDIITLSSLEVYPEKCYHVTHKITHRPEPKLRIAFL